MNSLFKDVDFSIKNQRDSVNRLLIEMKEKGFISKAAFRTKTTKTVVYYIWEHKDSGKGVLTITSELGESLIYELNKVRVEGL